MALQCLVADDVRHNRILATGWLKELGHEVVEACDGSEAWDLAQRHPLDLVVTDIEMPGLSGLDLLQHLRHHPRGKLCQVPVVVMSSLQDESLEEMVMSFGATIAVRKPLSKVEFHRVVIKALSSEPFDDTIRNDNVDPDAKSSGEISPTLRRIVDRARQDG